MEKNTNSQTIKPFISINVSESIKDEWLFKEEGSYEDHNRSWDHVYRVISKSPKNKIVCSTREEADMVLRSAMYQTSWDSDSPDVVRLVKGANRIVNILNEVI